MKKIFCLILVLLSTAQLMFGNLRQTKYRWRNDDGSQTTATWKAAENTAITISDFNTLRIRMELQVPANILGQGAAVDQNFEYSSDNGVSWNAMDGGPTSAFALVTSVNVPNATATTQQISAGTTGGFVAGKVVSAPGTPVTLASGKKTEYEWVLAPTNSVEPSTVYKFRSTGQAGTPLVYPTATTTCFVPPNAGAIIATSQTVSCHSKDTLRLSGQTSGAQITYSWQYNQGTGWTNFGTNVATVTTGYLIANTDFRCIVKCGTTQSDTTPVKSVMVLPLGVNLGPDIVKCTEGADSVFLDAGSFPNNPSYIWSDGLTSRTRYVHQSGIYSVNVSDTNFCQGNDAVDVGIWQTPPVDLGNDTNICFTGILTLTAGTDNTNAYVWSTGDTTAQITVQSPGTYSVKVISSKGCPNADTVAVTVSGQFPAIDNIFIRNDGYLTFKFSADNPRHVIAYDWDFGDGMPHSNEESPVHVYAAPGDYEVTLGVQSTCGGKVFTAPSHIVGINQLNISKEELLIAPNPAHGNVTILNHSTYAMKKIEVYDISGRMVYSESAENAKHHLLETGNLQQGMYLVKIISDKGFVMRKLELY